MLDTTTLKSYTLIKEESLKELDATGYILRHNVTGARVVAISTEDDNKVFTIGFRTPPKDDTGIAHIMEHSTLCGSKKYPVKDPFVELAKGSLNTFLNAMTYSDKTVYPVASCNLKDFENLMDVYLDAVFHPNIYERPEIMKQEGWHYDIESPEGELKINGVVYNEMKGVYSSPEDILFRNIQNSLLPNTTYGCESGGDPEFIPDLTREQFIDFHKTYYHPSNSYIYLYGDMDIAKELNYIDQEYLSDYDYREVDSEIGIEKPFTEMKRIEKEYSIADGEDEENMTYLSYNTIVADSLDRELYLAFQILDHAIIDVPGAPLKTALIDAGIGLDFMSSYDNGIKQPVYSLVSKGANVSDTERFVEVLENTLKKIVDEGIDKRSIEASMNAFEFKYKEANFGSYPKGLMYGLKLFDSWLYDDNKPFIHIQTDETFKTLKQKMHEGYFEELIKTYILDNPHKTLLVLKPKKGLNKEIEAKTAKKLADIKASLSAEEIEALIADKKALTEYQQTPSTPEELKTLPLLKLSDIKKEAKRLNNHEHKVSGIPVISHDIFTNDIAYVTLMFNLKDMPEEYYSYAALLSDILKYVDTDKRSYRELSNEININTGGITFSVSGTHHDITDEFAAVFTVSFKTFYDKLFEGFRLASEILFGSKIDDEKRLKEIIAECKLGLKDSLSAGGHLTAAVRAQSYISYDFYYKDITGGIGYYEFLDGFDKNFAEKKEELKTKLRETVVMISKKDNLIVSYTGKQDVEVSMKAGLDELLKGLSDEKVGEVKERTVPTIKNEGFKTASKVQYVATSGDFKQKGLKYTGALDVLKVIFSYDYLWINVRVTGGAYGAMCGFNRTGVGLFTSYRDPNLMETYEVYKNAVSYVKNFDCDERDMTKYVIGAFSRIDAPMTPQQFGDYSFVSYISGVTDEVIQRVRDEALGADVEAIRALAPIVEAIVDSGVICAVGGEEKIEENKDCFKEVKQVF
ncbi:MAG: insulinase family protein [Lachnospiraceae bacterium]|nr:insulinase family protein [Lachnospiraceae bacterium]